MQALRIGTAGVAMLLASVASAQLLEGFEHGNPALYTATAGTDPNFTLTGAAAHTGDYGAAFGAILGSFWYYRTDIATAPGNEYYVYVRMGFGADPSGRVYVGVGAGASGAFSMVAAPNTGEIILQNNLGYGFTNMASAPFAFTSGVWYQMRLNWASNGDMTVSLYDEAGTTLLAQTPTVATGYTIPGGIAFRGFTTIAGATSHVDDFGRVPGPAGLLVLAGLAPLARRRR